MGQLDISSLERVELSFFGPLTAHFGRTFPDGLKRSMSREFAELDVVTLSAAASSLLGITPPTAADCVEACRREANRAKLRRFARTAAELWTSFPGKPHIVQSGTPEWTLWRAICKAIGMRNAYYEMSIRDSWSVPCCDPHAFLAYCSSAGVIITVDGRAMAS